uniref:Na_Ca_ex domain-containing protein n=1 Tax=Meloidogyne hapla TaxID=6305 RepID=A0A1I8B4T6_MELHA
MLDRQQQNCQPSEFAKLGFQSICAYVQNHSEHCEGGGYLPWTEFKACASSTNLQLIVVIAAIIFFLFLFLHLSVAADSFFCENIATIVDVHNISQNIAGITFMAFGNGAPDIFGSIVSVISAPKPRADLAISELLGGSIFVTSCVVAAIALSRPFLLMRRPILRDICFHSAALVLLLIVANWEGKMPLWQPLAFLALYSIYATTVVSGNLLRQKMLKERKKKKKSSKDVGKVQRVIAKIMPKKITPAEICATEEKPTKIEEKKSIEIENSVVKKETERQIAEDQQKQRSTLQLPVNSLTIPKITSVCTIEDNDDNIFTPEEEFHALDYLEEGKFFGKEELDAEGERALSRSNSPLPLDVSSNRVSSRCYGSIIPSPSQTIKTDSGIIDCGRNTPLSPSGGSASTLSPCRSEIEILPIKRNKFYGIEKDGFYNKEFDKFWERICPLNWKKFQNAGWAGKIYRIIKIPSLLLLGLTIPRAGKWSKPLAMLQSFLFPLILCSAFKLFSLHIFNSLITANYIALIIALIISLFFVIIVGITTSFEKEPYYYKWISSHVGFVLSIAWIYATASEVVKILFFLKFSMVGL